MAMVLAFMVVAVVIAAISVDGFYQGSIVSLLLALIPMASKFYAKRIGGRSEKFQKNYFTTFTIVNALLIPAALWAMFVTMIDRVIPNTAAILNF